MVLNQGHFVCIPVMWHFKPSESGCECRILIQNVLEMLDPDPYIMNLKLQPRSQLNFYVQMAAAGDEAGVPLWHSPESAGGDLVLPAARHCGHQGAVPCCFILPSAVDPYPHWIQIQWSPWIRIRIRILNPYLDRGGQKWPTNIGNLINFISWSAGCSSPVAWHK